METDRPFKTKPVIFGRAFLCLAVLLAPGNLHAKENAYDLLGRTLRPFVGILAADSPDANRALQMRLRLQQMTALPRELVDASVDIAIQSPDRLRIQIPSEVLEIAGAKGGEPLTICRNGQEVWAHPASVVRKLLAALPESAKSPEAAGELQPFQLPIPEKQLVFMPALFKVRDVGFAEVAGAECRVLDVQLMPELAKQMEASSWVARVWIRGDATLARLTLARKGWHAVIAFDTVRFAPALAAETWQPMEAHEAEVVKLDVRGYAQLLNQLTRRE